MIRDENAESMTIRPPSTPTRRKGRPTTKMFVVFRVFLLTLVFVLMTSMLHLNSVMTFDNSASTELSMLSSFLEQPAGNSNFRSTFTGFDTDDSVSVNGSMLSSWLSEASNTTTSTAKVTNLFGKRNPPSFSTPHHSKYAYMFLIGGIDPSSSGYRGFLYNVMIATYLLRPHGSKSDIVLFLQMSGNATVDTLPVKEEKELQDLEIKYRYMERPQHHSFSHIIMEKFQILTLTQYDRITFMDADVLPVINLDYYMDLSMQGIFQPNYIVATRGEPANAGLFMVAPKEGDYEALQKIIDDQRESARDLGYPYFDKINGWGHSFIKDGDKWEGTERSGKKWGFWCAHADQGLLYYWTKYYQRAVTIFRGNDVENWVDGPNGKPTKNETLNPVNITQRYAPQSRSTILHNCHYEQFPGNYMCKMPYQDYMHYTGKSKPWQSGYKHWMMRRPKTKWWYDLWFSNLFQASDEFGWGIDGSNVNQLLKGDSPLGYMSWYGDRAKSEHNWTEAK